MKSIKILITGTNGFVGQALCRRLMALKYEVYGLDKNQPFMAGFADFYCQDITKAFELKENFDFVFHCAAHNVTHVGSQDADLYHQVNVVGTENVLKAVKTHHFIFLSTAKVYLSQGKPLDEDSPVLPLQEYEKSKLAAEQICFKHFDGDNLIVFRCVNIVGLGQPDKAVIPVLFKNAYAGVPLNIFVPRGSVLQFLYVEDAVDAFVKVIEKEHLFGIYNLACDECIPLDQLAGMIKEMCGSKSEIHFADESVPVFSQVLSIKAQNALGWKAKTSFREILKSYG